MTSEIVLKDQTPENKTSSFHAPNTPTEIVTMVWTTPWGNFGPHHLGKYLYKIQVNVITLAIL